MKIFGFLKWYTKDWPWNFILMMASIFAWSFSIGFAPHFPTTSAIVFIGVPLAWIVWGTFRHFIPHIKAKYKEWRNEPFDALR